MPHDDPDPTDPMTLHGVMIETDSASANREMAMCFIEEFLRMGFDGERLMKLFAKPEYAGPFMAYQELGEDRIRQLIDEQVQLRGPQLPRTHEPRTSGGISLPILNQ